MKNRLALVTLVTFSLFSVLLGMLFWRQSTEHEKWKALARRQHMTTLKERAPRGTLWLSSLARPGVKPSRYEAALDLPVYHLYADPTLLTPVMKEALIDYLGERLGMEGSELEHIRNQLSRSSRERRLLSGLSREMRFAIESEWKSFPNGKRFPRGALYFLQDYERSHPFGPMLGQLLHTVRHDRDPKTGESIPTGGLELRYHKWLEGRPGESLIARTPTRRWGEKEWIKEPMAGKDLELTIDPFLQAIAEKELSDGVKRAQAVSGFAVVMHAKTGALLAIAHYPFFDPDRYNEFFGDPKKIPFTEARVMSTPFEPGSIFKPVTFAMGLLANEELLAKRQPLLFNPKEKMAGGPTFFPGRDKAITDVSKVAEIDFEIAAQKSSNVYVAALAEKMIAKFGAEWYRKQLVERFHFGKSVNLPIPGESVGMIPRPGKLHPNGSMEWSRGTPYALAMGYNVMVNAFQMVGFYGMLANDGRYFSPFLIKGEQKEPISMLSPKIANELMRVLLKTTEKGGTAARGAIDGYKVVAKTGTVEKLINGSYDPTRHFTFFIGVAPVGDDPLVFLIALDDPDYSSAKLHLSGKSAAPIFRQIAERSLEFLGRERRQ